MATSERMNCLRRELRDYLSARSVTPEERIELEEWVRRGFSVYENPWYICFENGRLADYLWAKQFDEEMMREMLSETNGECLK